MKLKHLIIFQKYMIRVFYKISIYLVARFGKSCNVHPSLSNVPTYYFLKAMILITLDYEFQN